jgi:hypothetical protein
VSDEIIRKIDELRAILDCHSDLLGILNTQGVVNTAKQETVLSVLREVLSKHGIDKVASQKICTEIFAACLAIAQSENEKIMRSVDKSRLPSVSGIDAENN